MLLVRLKHPPILQIYFGAILQIVAFDVFPVEKVYGYLFDIQGLEAMNENFEQLGYENKLFLYNIGSLFPILILFIPQILLNGLLSLLPF